MPVEVHQALQMAMEKLQERFTSLMQEKADLKERVEELEHRCIQLSGETDTIGEGGGGCFLPPMWDTTSETRQTLLPL